MNSFSLIGELFLALKQELIRYRLPAVIIFSVALIGISALGLTWQNTYVTKAVLLVDDTNLIQPLLAGRAEVAEVDTSALAQEKVYSKQLLENVANRLGYIAEDTTAEEIGEIVAVLGAGIVLEPSTYRNDYFTISYYNQDPERSFQTMIILIEEFIEYHESSKREEGVYAFDFISNQVETYKERLEVAEENIKDFKSSSLDLSEEVVQRRTQELDSEIQELRLAIQEDRSRIRNIERQLSAETQYLEKQSKVFSLRSQRNMLEEQRRSLRMQFQDSYPDIVTLNEQIAELDRQISASGGENIITSSNFVAPAAGAENDPETLFRELRSLRSQTNVDLDTKEQRLKSLVSLLAEEQRKAGIVASNQARLSDLMRDYDVTKDVYEEMLSRRENAKLSMAITRDGQGISYKVVSDPIFPMSPAGLTFKHFALAAPVIAIGMPLGILAALILLDPRIRTVTNLDMILEGRSNLLGVAKHCHSAIAERLLRKDMFVLCCVSLVMCFIYVYIVYLGLVVG